MVYSTVNINIKRNEMHMACRSHKNISNTYKFRSWITDNNVQNGRSISRKQRDTWSVFNKGVVRVWSGYTQVRSLVRNKSLAHTWNRTTNSGLSSSSSSYFPIPCYLPVSGSSVQFQCSLVVPCLVVSMYPSFRGYSNCSESTNTLGGWLALR